jgi:hypothetical protein
MTPLCRSFEQRASASQTPALYPLPLWERVVSSVSEKPGEGYLTLAKDPSPGSHLAMLATLSHKGRG